MKSTQQAIRVRSTAELDRQDTALQTPMPYLLTPDSTWFAAIAHSSPDLVGAVSLEGDWICLNPAGRSHLSWASELPPLMATFSQETQQQWQDIALPTLMQYGYWCGQMALCDASNQLIWMESQWFLVRDRDTNEPICIATISHRLANTFETAPVDQQSLADAAHEIKNPLTVIASSTDILQTRYDRLDNARREKHFQRIHTKVKQITQVLDDLLTLSQTEHCLDTPAATIDVIDLCTTLIEEAQITTSKHEIIFSSELSDRSSQLCLNSVLLERVITNLLSNSIKYSPLGGKIYFNLSLAANCLMFQVRDRGIGIAIADQRQLFETFYRASNVGSISGTGLGLAIVKRCVERLGGQITVNSEVGIGTVFDVKIPIPDIANLFQL